MTRVHTPFGDIFPPTGSCEDNYPNIKTVQTAAGQLLKLQEPAARAFLEAERLNGHKLPWKKHRKPKPIRITGEGWRSCSSQYALWRDDPGRFANPNGSLHCRGLAVDVFYSSTNLTSRARNCLQRVGFHFSVPGEPWHISFHEVG